MFATIYLPNFYLQAAMRHQPELCAKPVALIEEQEKKPVIIQLNEAAENARDLQRNDSKSGSGAIFARGDQSAAFVHARENRSRKFYSLRVYAQLHL